ncbi:MAG TPA: glycosyl transferase [Methylophaga sp.]|jgi:anthranilate phosphoribosyltransferase|uniref:anthranilate phosphoribosyltransferase n=1 Tax=unclassified Methylophaga TaxID=2629249 RepID=UPI000C8DEB8B|nr:MULTISPECIES: glycosyl transferase [unclassified Methylophaga]MAP25565.1 glycosyl transferase [Methylophaga sp.]HAD32851.1 glycosyl transferase [Methylophaga sp.]HCN99656.1 glycosyl transferase [Methylophaga sp.]|tara:strand:- start:10279 stop:11325 length:1047 start_codon:yes stop_codon:yes gene_type:complete
MSAVADAIKKVATGPHLSKDLSLEESREAMLEILSGEVDPVRMAVMLIALRMKRETDEENLGLLLAIQEKTGQHPLDVDNVMLLSDPFNGFSRHCPIAAFLPAVMAACGLPALSQGVYQMAPKFGVTHAQVLEAAGVNIQLTVAEAAEQLNHADTGWAYLDQAITTPSLFALQDLRRLMIKRPSLATLEKLVMPVKAKKTHLQIGFVHKAYPPVLAYLAKQSGFDSALIVRGLEGGIVPTLRETSDNFLLIDGALKPCSLDPQAFGVDQQTRGVMPDLDQLTAAESAQRGIAALQGEKGVAYDLLVYGAAMALWHCGLVSDQNRAGDLVRKSLDSGNAFAAFEKGRTK